MSIIKTTLPDLFLVSLHFFTDQDTALRLHRSILYAADATTEINSQSIRCASIDMSVHS